MDCRSLARHRDRRRPQREIHLPVAPRREEIRPPQGHRAVSDPEGRTKEAKGMAHGAYERSMERSTHFPLCSMRYAPRAAPQATEPPACRIFRRLWVFAGIPGASGAHRRPRFAARKQNQPTTRRTNPHHSMNAKLPNRPGFRLKPRQPTILRSCTPSN